MSPYFIAFALLVAVVNAAPQHNAQQPPAQEQRPPPIQINWGKCEQLKPTDSDKEQKRQVIEKCLGANPPPNTERITREQIEQHRDVITSCALKEEGWFDTNGSYKFDRARTEIKSKKLQSDIEGTILKKHDECEQDAKQRFQEPTEQVKLYQACMDYHISETCNIHVIPPPGHQFPQGPPPQQGPQRG
ncbi:uncharacterized protein LOC111635376 [Centruroides sculpturatus]|uniref:uncharacterized protein LOC111635376 n=1 Tax=Centruroides sculpturatus TaxID=218467 RepID=UPI000C6ED616|nr:uncharacterized protein LOC111635376 [Centruroides sculpturatus]